MHRSLICAVDAVGGIVDFSARDSKHGLPALASRYTCEVSHLRLASIGQPERLLGDRLVDPADDFLIRGIRRLERRLQRHRDLVHAIGRARCGNSLGGRRDVHAGQFAGVRDVRVQHDGRNPLQVIDRRLRHRCARVGPDDEGRVAIAANQHVDRGELARIIARIAAIERDAERKAGLPAHDHVGPGHVAVAAHRHGDELREGVHFRGQHRAARRCSCACRESSTGPCRRTCSRTWPLSCGRSGRRLFRASGRFPRSARRQRCGP